MSSGQMRSAPLGVATSGQEAAVVGIVSSLGEPNRQEGGCRRPPSKDMGSALPEGIFGNAPSSGGFGLQRTMSKDMGGKENPGTLPGGGLQRTMSKDLGGPQSGGLQRTVSRDLGGPQYGGLQRAMSRDLGGSQPGGLQRTMSRDLGTGPQPGGLQRTMSRDLGTAQPGGGGLQRTMSRGLGNATATRQPRKTPGKGDRIPKSAGCQESLPRPNPPGN